MTIKLKLQHYYLTLLLLVSTSVFATEIEFEASMAEQSFAQVHFQFSDSTNSLTLDEKVNQQLEIAREIYEFSAEFGDSIEILAPSTMNSRKLVVFGLGQADDLTHAKLVSIGGKLAQKFAHKDARQIDVVLSNINAPIKQEIFAAHIAQGLSLGSYRFNRYLQNADTPNNTYRMVVNDKTLAQSSYAPLNAIESGVFLARDLVSANGAEVNPVTFIEQAKKSLKGLDVELDVYNAKKIERMGMGLLHSVGKGSVSGSRLLVAHYKGSDSQPIAIVGKGVTFDTGGYNIKTHRSIAEMKGDMSGAAAVLGTIKALAHLEASVNVIAVMPLAENMVSETALLPGDIITSLSGKSVEIKNTDAEGRLLLADANWYVQEQYQPKVVLNIATLTGSKIRAVGTRYAALFSDDEEISSDLIAAGKAVNEPLWQLPLDYGDMLKSTLADTSNIGSGGPGASTAAMFLKQFIQEETRWAHLDIAGNELTDNTKDEVPAGGVGYGVRLMVEWLNNQSY